MSTRVLRGTLLSGIKHSTHHVPKKPRGVTRQGRLRSFSLTHRRQRVYASTVEESETFEDMCDQSWWQGIYVRDIMTPNPLAVSPETSVVKALEILTESDVTGIPVVEHGNVVGVVTANDILSLDSAPGHLDQSDGFFPPIGRCAEQYDGDEQAMWRSFLNFRSDVDKTRASKVGDSMHETYCVSINDSLSDVASLIVRKNTQRAFVLDENRELCGVVSTGDVLKITMQKYREFKKQKH